MSKTEKLAGEISAIKEKMADPKLAQGTADTYTRISGYHRATSRWCDGKASEYNDRKEYVV